MRLSLSSQHSTLWWWGLITSVYTLLWLSAPYAHAHAIPNYSLNPRSSHPHSSELQRKASPQPEAETSACENPAVPSYFDYSVKKRPDPNADAQVCSENTFLRAADVVDDYSCSESKPCSNGIVARGPFLSP